MKLKIEYKLILLIGFFIGLILVLLTLSYFKTKDQGNKNIDVSKDLVEKNIDNTIANDDKFFNDKFYEYFDIENLEVKEFHDEQDIYSDHLKFGFSYLNVSSIKFILIDASNIDNSKEIYEKVYISQSPTGKLVDTYSTVINGQEVSMALMIKATGPGIYDLIGGIKDGDKGYYFEVLLDPKINISYSEADINNIFSFNYSKVPHGYLDLIKKVIAENIPQTAFKEYINNFVESEIKSLKENNSGLFPSTF